eukprot:TRINITY_DN9723_c0_g1_i5.p1 TRINITY_DN9723_c0_g1~~TRINITY_DN9723_c0_g1_i5.p1  ORF type:complete len:1310 (+),score=179.37 TRINITY_DN9723_c0_g1_i5:40-3969(+)
MALSVSVALTLAVLLGSATLGDSKCPIGSIVSGSDCLQCDPGKYASFDECKDCYAGKFSNDTFPSSSFFCASCPSGFVSNGTGCIQCKKGKYVSSKGDSCVSCGLPYMTTTIDGAPNSSYCVDLTNCKDETKCPGNTQLCPIGTVSFAGECSPCRFGYTDERGLTGCKFCPPGQEPNATKTGCAACPPRRFSTLNDGAYCQKCQPGYVATSDREGCEPCDEGTFASRGSTSNTCAVCPAASFNSERGQEDCKSCQAGKVSAADRKSCQSCPPGQWTSKRLFCQPWSDCAPGTYVSTPAPSTSTDRICWPCPKNRYTNVSNAASCNSSIVCEAGFYASAEPTRSTDRVCSACPAGTFTTTMTANRNQCAPWSVCPPGTQVDQEGTSSKDRECTPCPAGFSNASNSRVCKLHTACPAGTYQSVQPTLTSDRGCTSCPAGTFTTATTAKESQCQPWTVCEAGSFVETQGAADRDRTCQTCTSGWTNTSNAERCNSISDCPAGSYTIADATSTSDRVCNACPGRTFTTTATSNEKQCEPWNDCGPGTKIETQGSSTNDRVCTNCTDGWSVLVNAQACNPPRDCPAGSYVLRNYTATTDRDCFTCPPETFTTTATANNNQCEPWTNCRPGSYVNLTGATNRDRACAACESGFTSTSNALTCTESRDCDAGSYASADPTATSDRMCSACPPQQFTLASTSNNNQCQQWTDCQPGTKIDVDGASDRDRTCVACTDGWTNMTNADSCNVPRDCTAGHYASGDPTGTSDRVCSPCPDGTFTLDAMANANKCRAWTVCTGNEYQFAAPNSTADRVCSKVSPPCHPATQVQFRPPTSTSDRICNPRDCSGGFRNQTSGECIVCPDGQFQHDGVNNPICWDHSPCPSGWNLIEPGTTVSDRVCRPSPHRCIDRQLLSGSDLNIVGTCECSVDHCRRCDKDLSVDGAILISSQYLPETVPINASAFCQSIPVINSSESSYINRASACSQACLDDENCKGFELIYDDDVDAFCCLVQSFAPIPTRWVHNTAFFKTILCESCDPGADYYFDTNKCVHPPATTPVVLAAASTEVDTSVILGAVALLLAVLVGIFFFMHRRSVNLSEDRQPLTPDEELLRRGERWGDLVDNPLYQQNRNSTASNGSEVAKRASDSEANRALDNPAYQMGNPNPTTRAQAALPESLYEDAATLLSIGRVQRMLETNRDGFAGDPEVAQAVDMGSYAVIGAENPSAAKAVVEATPVADFEYIGLDDMNPITSEDAYIGVEGGVLKSNDAYVGVQEMIKRSDNYAEMEPRAEDEYLTTGGAEEYLEVTEETELDAFVRK